MTRATYPPLRLFSSGSGSVIAASGWVGGSAMTGGAATVAPCRARLMSARISAADWYRLAGFLVSAFMTIASASPPMSGVNVDGGTGFSRTCWYATATGDSPWKGGRPVSSS